MARFVSFIMVAFIAFNVGISKEWGRKIQRGREVLLIGILVCACYTELGVGVSFLLYPNNYLRVMEIKVLITKEKKRWR